MLSLMCSPTNLLFPNCSPIIAIFFYSYLPNHHHLLFLRLGLMLTTTSSDLE